MQPDVASIHELFVGVEALGSQLDLHLGEEMVIAWRQVRIVRGRSKICQLQSLSNTFVPDCKGEVQNLPVEELE